ncbi:hypothetical protein GCM10010182_11590 [Actinomadura cremea]|nr:hypothetical protein GCM10010182_11590 [Actinomadura cremea]
MTSTPDENRLPPLGAGRAPAAAAIRRWATDRPRSRLCVVTGAPGTGKSRLLAWAAADIAGDRAVNAMLSARGMSARAVAWALADQLLLPGGDPPELVARVTADRRPGTILVGELDESGAGCDGAAATEIVAALLDPLLETRHVRLLVEGRPDALAGFTAPAEVVHLDSPDMTDRDAFTGWLREVAAARGITDPAAVAAAAALYPNAGLAELALHAGSGPDVPGRRLAQAPAAARPAVEALASAFEPLDPATWESWTVALTGDRERARQAVAAAAPLTARSAAGVSLGCRPLREAVLAARTPQLAAQIGNSLGYALYESTPKEQGRPDWSRAAPYVTRHLLRHALGSGTAPQLLADLGCALRADPLEVTSVLDALAATTGDATGDAPGSTPASTPGGTVPLGPVWRAAGPALLAAAGPAERAAILHLAASRRHDGLAGALARHLAGAPWSPVWAGRRPDPARPAPWTGPVTALAFGAGEREGRLLAATMDGPLHLLSPSDGAPVGRIVNETPALRGLVCLPDGGVLHLDPHGVLGLISPRKAKSRTEQIGDLLNAAPGAGTGIDSGEVLRTAERLSTSPTALGAARDAAMLVVGDRTGTVRAWRPGQGASEAVSRKLHDGPVTAVTCLRGPRGGDLVVSGGADGTVRYWTPGEEPRPEPADLRDGSVHALAGALAGARPVVVVGWNNGDVHLWDLATGHDAVVRPGFVPTALLLEGDGTLYAAGPDGLVALRLALPATAGT